MRSHECMKTDEGNCEYYINKRKGHITCQYCPGTKKLKKINKCEISRRCPNGCYVHRDDTDEDHECYMLQPIQLRKFNLKSISSKLTLNFLDQEYFTVYKKEGIVFVVVMVKHEYNIPTSYCVVLNNNVKQHHNVYLSIKTRSKTGMMLLDVKEKIPLDTFRFRTHSPTTDSTTFLPFSTEFTTKESIRNIWKLEATTEIELTIEGKEIIEDILDFDFDSKIK